MQDGGQTAWTLPCPVVGLAQLTPSPEEQPQDLGRGAGQTRTQSPGMSQSQPERWRSPHEGPDGSMPPRALLLSCKGNRQVAPCSPSFLHSKQTRREQTKHKLEWSPLLSSRGAARRPRMWTESPGKPRSHPTTHPKQQHTVLPWAQAKARPQPRLKKQPSENDVCPSGSWTSPQSLEDSCQ